MTKDTEEFLQFAEQVTCREFSVPRDENSSGPNGLIRGPKIGPVLEVTTSCEVNMEWKLELILKNNDKFSLVAQNFSWHEKVGHGLEQQGGRRQRARNLRDAVRRICVENECTCFCEPIKSQSKTTKTYFCQLIHKNYSYWEKNLDRY